MSLWYSTSSYKQELSDVVTDVCGWWGGCEAVMVWLDEAEKTLSSHTPLASSMDIVGQQKRNIEVRTCTGILKGIHKLCRFSSINNGSP